MRWVHPAGPKRDLQLMTVSSDGTARQWLLKLGFKPHVLIELKRAPNRAQLGSGETQGSSREASGMCLDAPWDDPTQYYVGTEEGLIHKCSVSYNEQTLESYVAHTGPVYRVACSPFLPSLILSCSSDWTCLLWHHKVRTGPSLSLLCDVLIWTIVINHPSCPLPLSLSLSPPLAADVAADLALPVRARLGA